MIPQAFLAGYMDKTAEDPAGLEDAFGALSGPRSKSLLEVITQRPGEKPLLERLGPSIARGETLSSTMNSPLKLNGPLELNGPSMLNGPVNVNAPVHMSDENVGQLGWQAAGQMAKDAAPPLIALAALLAAGGIGTAAYLHHRKSKKKAQEK